MLSLNSCKEAHDLSNECGKSLGTDLSIRYTSSLSKSTVKCYTIDIKQFFSVSNLQDITLDMITSVNVDDANAYIRVLKEKYKPTTINRKLTALTNFYAFLCRREVSIMSYNPFETKQGAKRIRTNKQYSTTRCLTQKEVSKFFEQTISDRNIESLRNSIIILTLITTGMRVSELTHLTLDKIKKSGEHYYFETKGKYDKENMVKITSKLLTLIYKYLQLRGLTFDDKQEYLISRHTTNSKYFKVREPLSTQSIQKVIKKIAERAGIDSTDISPHCFRHTFVTEALRKGIAIQDVSTMVNHADISTTRRYEHTMNLLDKHPADSIAEDLFKNISTPCS